MKVALLCNNMPVTSETFVLRHVRGLLEAGVDLTILTQSIGTNWDSVPAHLREEIQARTKRVDPKLLKSWRRILIELPRSVAAWPLALRYLKRRLFRHEPELGRHDAIIAHFGPRGIEMLSLRENGAIAGPIGTIFHGFDMSMHDTIKACLPGYRRLFRETELLLPISRFWGERLQKWGADPAKIRVLRMGVDAMPDATAQRPPLGRPLRVLTVGRFVEKKGIAYAIEGVRASKTAVRFEIIGDGNLESELKALAGTTPGTNEIIFRGAIPHGEVLEALRETDIFLLPSVTAESGDMEGIPVALMEAMMHGCIVISTWHSGIPELIEDGVSGILVPERSSPGIADALDAIAQGRYDLDEMRRNAVVKVAGEFNNDQLDRQLVAFLADMAQGSAFGR